MVSELRDVVVVPYVGSSLRDIGEDSDVDGVAGGAIGDGVRVLVGGLEMEFQVGASFVRDELPAPFAAQCGELFCGENCVVGDPNDPGVGRSVVTSGGVFDAVVDVYPQVFDGSPCAPSSCHALVVGV